MRRPGLFDRLVRRHLFSKLFISFLAMAALTVGLLWLVQAGLMRDIYLDSRIDRVRLAVAEAAIEVGAIEQLDLDALAEASNATILVVPAGADSGRMMGMSERMPMMGNVRRQIQAMIAAEDWTGYTVLDASGSTTGRYALIGQPLADGSHVFALFSLSDVDAAAAILRDQLALITALLLLFAIALAVVLSLTLSRPILAATDAARQLATGQLDVRLPVHGQDEIADLGQALNALSRQLQTNEKLRRELIANVSHELRSPLTVIRGYAETVRDVTWPDETKRSAQLTLIADEAARLTRVVGDILDYSKLQAGVRPPEGQTFAAGPVLEAARQRFELEAANRTLRLTLETPQPDVNVSFDPGQFEQVLTNLVANAINYADPDSVVQISLQRVGRQARIDVVNQGDPIPAEELGQIWDRYYRSSQVRDDNRLGTGLGLAIVRSILEQHGVRYGVESHAREIRFWFETKPA
jgi:signal transduction histidine kinase